jgi:alkylhydroperoxidase family enzyme
MTTTEDETAAGTPQPAARGSARPRWGVSSVRRVAPLVRVPFQPEMLNNALSFARQPLPLVLLTLAGYSGAAGRDTLTATDRELVTLRTTWNCGGYLAYAAHVPIAKALRKGRDMQAAIEAGPADPQWTSREAALLRVVDELQQNFRLPDALRTEVAVYFSERQLMEIAAICAMYEAVSMTIGSAGMHTPGQFRALLRTEVPNPGPGLLRRRREPDGPGLPRAANWALTESTVVEALARHARLAWAVRWFGSLAARFSVLAGADVDRVVTRVAELLDGAARTTTPVHAPGWRRPVLIRKLVDELHLDRFVSDETWLGATELFSDRELIDICVLVGGLRFQHLVARAAA